MKLTQEWLSENRVSFESDDNGITVGGWLDLLGTQISELPDNLTVGGWLDLSGTQISELPDNLTVGGSLYLSDTQITALPDNLTVGGSLYLRDTQISELHDNLTVGGWLDLRGTQISELPDNLTVGGSLDLSDTQITALPDNLTVGGWLDLRGTQISELPDNLTVGGWLDLLGTQISELPDNLTVGGSLDLRGTQIKKKKVKKPQESLSNSIKISIESKFNSHGYTIADGILAKILHKKEKIMRVLVVGKKEPSWLVSDGSGNYAHGSTLEDAAQELAFKSANRDVSAYKNMPKDTVKTPKEWAFIYRLITGACKTGTAHFMGQHELKERYTLSEIIELTRGAYGHEHFVEVVG